MFKTSHGRRTLTFRLPNCLILDGSLSFNARRMGAVLFSRRNHLGTCRRSLTSLAKLANCSVTTARKSLGELVDAGYITRCKHFKYSETEARLVYDQYTYHCDLSFKGGYTLIPRTLFCHTLKSSSFVVCLYLHLQAGNGNRAFPSLRRICKDLWIAKSTVCRAIRALGAANLVFAQACVKTNGAYSCNSYFFLCVSDTCRPAAILNAQDAIDIFAPSTPLNFTQRHRPPRSRSAPFPCPHYRLVKGKIQAVSRGVGGFKIDKLKLRLR